jgi:putative redox protein
VKIILLSDEAIRLEPIPGPMTIEALTPEQSYSPFHMLGSSLAYCTFSVMSAWATHADLNADDLAIEVRWTFAEDPHRVSNVDLTFEWPSLPAKRLTAAKRVAEMCTVHATLLHPPLVSIEATQAVADRTVHTPESSPVATR